MHNAENIPRSANYGTSPGTFIYCGASPVAADTSELLLSLEGGNVSRTEPSEEIISHIHRGILGRQKDDLKPSPDLGCNRSRSLSASFSCVWSSIPVLKCKMRLHSAYPRDFCKSLTSMII